MDGWINVSFIEIDEAGEEQSAGEGKMPYAPRVGEVIWFQPGGKKPPYKVTDVCYWVGDYTLGCRSPYCKAAVYVKPIAKN
jgi:hypothetical protein